jgi:ankyrin repeat protein
LDEEDESGETVLDWAVKNEHDGVLHLLIESGLSRQVEEELPSAE